LSGHGCDSHAKWVQLIAEYYQVPLYVLDLGIADLTEKKTQRKIEYLTAQLFDCVEWLEHILGKKFDEERFREAFINTTLVGKLWAEICSLNKAIPAPFDQKSQYSFFAFPLLAPHRKETVELYQELRDELKWRVENKIAAVETERCRLFHDGQPPWGFLKIFRYMEKYGAVGVGGIYGFSLGATWDWDKMEPAQTPLERGIPLDTRDDLIKAYAEWYIKSYIAQNMLFSPIWKAEVYIKTMKEWHIDGLLVHLNRGCEGWAFGQLEMRLGVVKAGYPVLTYEGNMSDNREFDESQTLDRLEAFLQSLGLKKIVD
jgi:benzoyl-CoA reductase subunit B